LPVQQPATKMAESIPEIKPKAAPKALPSGLRPAMIPAAVRIQRAPVARPRPAAAHAPTLPLEEHNVPTRLVPTREAKAAAQAMSNVAAPIAVSDVKPAAEPEASYDDFLASMKELGAF